MPGSQMHPLHTIWHHEKPLPQPPSPTLTNPDHILPSSGLPNVSSPPRLLRRPPSPSYLRDTAAGSPSTKSVNMGRKEKLGLMSRKMMLLRSRTASSGNVNASPSPRSQSSHDTDFVPSSPVLQDVGNLAPEQNEFLQLPDVERRSASGGSSSSEISGLTSFLDKYTRADGTSDDELVYDSEASPAPAHYDNPADQDSELDAERRKQQLEEYNSAILSKRAEQILANAKKRLNVMEGNLRGARDLVAPLTAANLKRATSLGSAHYTSALGHRYGSEGHEYDERGQHTSRTLHTQTSSPVMAHEYAGHSRGFSETELPERPYTALDSPRYVMSSRAMRAAAPAQPLRGSRSYDSIGGSGGIGYGIGRDRPLHHARDSPDFSPLEPLQETDEYRRSIRSGRTHDAYPRNNGLGIYRPSSRTSDIREQMNSLKGKISTLKERAREDSLRRQSQAHLRDSSPLNNASVAAPEFFYNASSDNGSLTLDTNAGLRCMNHSAGHSPASPQASRMWANGSTGTSSRNAFAENATIKRAGGIQQARVVEIMASRTPESKVQLRRPKISQTQPAEVHKRTPSGTAIVDSAKDRYSHYQYNNSQEVPGAYVSESEDDLGVPPPVIESEQYDSYPVSSVMFPDKDQGYKPSEGEVSVYEDTLHEQSSIVAHEDREDAFDYEHFFLHSAMGTYKNRRRGSESSEVSMSSVETAKGPAPLEYEIANDDFDHGAALYPPPTPETPERLKEIERHLHRRALSNESISTLNTYATADEGLISPVGDSPRQYERLERRPVSVIETAPRAQTPIRTYHLPATRPGTAVRRTSQAGSGSDRADSGVLMSHRSVGYTNGHRRLPGSGTPKLSTSRSVGGTMSSSPTSPRGTPRPDPVSIAVNALLDTEGRELGLRNKAVVFSVVESLRQVINMLQEQDEGGIHSRVLRKRLEDAKIVLDSRGL